MDRLLEIALGNAGSAILLALAAALASRIIRRPSLVHAMWVLVLLRLVVPPMFEFELLPAPTRVVGGVSAMTPTTAPAVSTAETYSAASRGGVGVLEVGIVIWVSGAFFILGLAVLRVERLRRLLRLAGPADIGLEKRVSGVAHSMGISRLPTVKMIAGGAPPMLWGFIGSPTLILPAPLMAELRDDEQEALIAHELAHFGRRDHWVRCLELVSALAFWWHPVTWWARRRLRVAEELCCDLEVTRRLPDLARAYAGCLVKTVRFLSLHPPAVAAGSAMANFHDLKGRITMIMTAQKKSRTPLALRAVFVFFAAALLALSPTFAARDGGGGHTDFSGDPITLELQDASLRDLLASFSRITDLTFVLHPSAEEAGLLEQTVSINFFDTPWDEVLDTILEIRGLDWTREGSVVWIHPKWQPPAGEENGVGDRSFTGVSITLNFEGADVRDVLETFEKITGLEIWVAAEVEGRVTANLDDIPWDQALDLIIQIAGLQYRREGEAIFVERRSEATGEVLAPHNPPIHTEVDRGDAEIHRFVVGGPVSEPLKIGGPNPIFPEEAREAGEGGVVVLEIVVWADGSVDAVEVLRGLPHGLTESAVDAVRQWRFEPGVFGGEPVAVSYILTVRFSLGYDE